MSTDGGGGKPVPMHSSVFTTEPVPAQTIMYAADAANRMNLTDLVTNLDTDQPHEIPDGQTVIHIDIESAGKKKKKSKQTQFGWFSGVFGRCLLNIWGVIMYLRLGWVVGTAGLPLALMIVIGAVAITFLTALSLSAISTNGAVKGGGVYYLISRTLGPQYGGTIGVVFFVANAISSAMYTIGFTESFLGMIYSLVSSPVIHAEVDGRIVSTIIIILIVLVCLVGVGWVIKTDMFLLVLLVASILAFFVGIPFIQLLDRDTKGITGLSLTTLKDNLAPAFDSFGNSGQTVFTVFAIFFPACTGIMAGANISGDLKDASKAIPKGTLRAIFVSTIVYVIMVFALASVATRSEVEGEGLTRFNLIMSQITILSPLFYMGVFAATLSSALASFVGAPRILQKMCQDNLFPAIKFLGKGSGKNNEPYRAYAITFLITFASIMLNNLDLITPIISNFFLISYGSINYACFATSMGKSPGWRPSFRFYNRWLALLATALCIIIMFMASWVTAAVSIALCLAVFIYLHFNPPDVNWGDASQAALYNTALNATLKLNQTDMHVKNYRPQCLVLTGDLNTRPHLVRFAIQLAHARGVVVCGNVITSDQVDLDAIHQHTVEARKFLADRHVNAFYDVTTSKDTVTGARHLMLTSGLGRLRPDTVVIGFPHSWQADTSTVKTEEFIAVLREACLLNKGVVVLQNFDVDLAPLRAHPEGARDLLDRLQGDPGITIHSMDKLRGLVKDVVPFERSREFKQATRRHVGSIDVYWMVEDGGLTVLLPHVLRKHPAWSGCKLRIITTAREDNVESHTIKMRRIMADFRIKAEVVIIPEEFLTSGIPADDEKRHALQMTVSAAKTMSATTLPGVLMRTMQTDAQPRLTAEKTPTGPSTVFDIWRIDDDGELGASVVDDHDVSPFPMEDGTVSSEDEDEPGHDGLCLSDAAMLGEIPIPPLLRAKTLRFMRLARVMSTTSSGAALTVVNIPVPRLDVPINVLMAWMDLLSHEGRPTILMRGNGQTALTYDA